MSSSAPPLLAPLLSVLPFAAVALVALGAAALLTRGRRPSTRDEVQKTAFRVEHVATAPLTETEAKFFHRLVEALPEAVVVPQMAMSALVDVAEHQKRGKHARYLNTNRAGFSQKRLDYVLLDRESLEVVCVIELDDHTHDAAARKTADAERDAILAGVGYPVLRFDARKMPTAAELREQLDE